MGLVVSCRGAATPISFAFASGAARCPGGAAGRRTWSEPGKVVVLLDTPGTGRRKNQPWSKLTETYPWLGGISNAVGRGFENTIPSWRTIRHQATKSYSSRRTTRRRSQPRNSLKTATTVFEIPLISGSTTPLEYHLISNNQQRTNHS